MNNLTNKYGQRYQMIATAELFNQKPNDPMFKKFSPAALEGVKRLAKSLVAHGVSRKKKR